MTARTTTPTSAGRSDKPDYWTAAIERILSWARPVGPALMLVAALLVSFEVQMLPGDLDWISEPEGLVAMLAAPFLFAAWIAVGRRVSEAAPRTGVVVSVLGAMAATSFVNPMGQRLFSADLVELGVDPTVIHEAWDVPNVYSALSVPLVFLLFLVSIIAGVAILKTGVAPRWSGAALIAFVPAFVAAQGASVAIRVTYPLAAAILLIGVVGATRGPAAKGAPG